MEELCIDGSRRRVVAWAKCIQDDLKIQLRVYRTNRNQTYRYSNYTASLHSLWVNYHCFPDRMFRPCSVVSVPPCQLHLSCSGKHEVSRIRHFPSSDGVRDNHVCQHTWENHPSQLLPIFVACCTRQCEFSVKE